MVPNYTPFPGTPAAQQAAGGNSLVQGLEALNVGLEIGDKIAARRMKKSIAKIVSKDGPLADKDFRRIAAIDPVSAKALFALQKDMDEMRALPPAEFRRELAMMDEQVDMTGTLAQQIMNVPMEQREAALTQLLGPLLQNQATQGFAENIYSTFDAAGLEDDSLMAVLAASASQDERLKFLTNNMDRKLETRDLDIRQQTADATDRKNEIDDKDVRWSHLRGMRGLDIEERALDIREGELKLAQDKLQAQLNAAVEPDDVHKAIGYQFAWMRANPGEPVPPLLDFLVYVNPDKYFNKETRAPIEAPGGRIGAHAKQPPKIGAKGGYTPKDMLKNLNFDGEY